MFPSSSKRAVQTSAQQIAGSQQQRRSAGDGPKPDASSQQQQQQQQTPAGGMAPLPLVHSQLGEAPGASLAHTPTPHIMQVHSSWQGEPAMIAVPSSASDQVGSVGRRGRGACSSWTQSVLRAGTTTAQCSAGICVMHCGLGWPALQWQACSNMIGVRSACLLAQTCPNNACCVDAGCSCAAGIPCARQLQWLRCHSCGSICTAPLRPAGEALTAVVIAHDHARTRILTTSLVYQSSNGSHNA